MSALDWWIMFCTIFVFLDIIEYVVAISWAHAVNCGEISKEEYLNENKGWFHVVSKLDDMIIVAVYGPIDFHEDPWMRNKVDYNARIFFPAFYVLFVLIYISICICPWSFQYNW